VAFTLQSECKDLAHRKMLVCSSREDAVLILTENNPNRLLSGVAEPVRRPVVFMLPGIGDQYVGMGHGLYLTSEVFREEVDRCAGILEPLLGADIRTLLYPASRSWLNGAARPGIDLRQMVGGMSEDPPDLDTARLDTTLFAQPALFTIEYATARLWMSLGITPDALVGHSMGEYVAACLAEVMSLEDALRLIATRATLVSKLPGTAMLAVVLSEKELRPLLQSGSFISLINGPEHCVVAGTEVELGALQQTLAAREITVRRVRNGHAFHTRLLQPILEPFEVEAGKAQLAAPKIPFISNLTGDWMTAADATCPSYWVRHASHTAQFSDGLRRMWQMDRPVLIECGPGKTLNVLAAQHPDRKATLRSAIWSMRQRYEKQEDERVLLAAIGKVWLAGRAIKWDRIPRSSQARRIRLADGSVRKRVKVLASVAFAFCAAACVVGTWLFRGHRTGVGALVVVGGVLVGGILLLRWVRRRFSCRPDLTSSLRSSWDK
jgi:acyl transferase domain-containing protein